MNPIGRLRNTYAEIHLGRLRSNLEVLRGLSDPRSFFCPMVKADGYGHSDVEVTKVLEDAGLNWVGVSLIEEGIRLRQAGVRLNILSFAFFDKHGAEEIVRYSLTPVLSSWDQIEKIKRQLSDGQRYPVHIKFNTGMSRLGFEVEEAQKVRDFLDSTDLFRLEGVCTHLLNSEDTGDFEGRTLGQQRAFTVVEKAFSTANVFVHYLNSAALLRGAVPHPQSPNQERRFLGVRPGIALYGVWPEIKADSGIQLQPVMELKSVLGQVRTVKTGETVSYGGRWKAAKESIIGVVPIGYADGYSRQFSNKGKMLFRGQLAPVIGSVCMDYTLIDLTEILAQGADQRVDQRTIRPGEEVVVFGSQSGNHLPVDELARAIGTISYEILTCLGKRIPRVMHHG